MAGRPSVTIREISVAGTQLVSAGSGRLAYVVESEKGKAFQYMYPTNETDLINMIGRPTTTAAITDFELCKQYFNYGNDLVIIRAVNEDTAQMSRVGGEFSGASFVEDALTDTADEKYFRYPESHSIKAGLDLEFYAQSPAAEGDNLTIAICKPVQGTAWADDVQTVSTATGSELFNTYFEFGPDYANQEIAILIFESGVVVENFIVSLNPLGKNLQGQNIYLPDYIQANSEYIYAFAKSGLTYAEVVTATDIALDNGTKGTSPTLGDLEAAYDMFANKNDITFDYIIDGSHNDTTDCRSKIQVIAELRKDCVAFLGTSATHIFTNGAPKSNVQTIVDDTVTDRASMTSSSWCVYVSNWKEIYTKYLDKNIWLPITADIAGLKVATNAAVNVWTPIAGTINGRLRNVNRLAFNPTDLQQDTLYKNGVNAVIVKRGVGPILTGQKTMITQNYGVSRLNIRDLFRTIEIQVGIIAEDYLHQVNDAVTRARFVNQVEPILRDIQSAGGLVRFSVICDETLNTDAVINSYGFRANIYIEGFRSIENILLNFFDSPAGVAFTELA